MAAKLAGEPGRGKPKVLFVCLGNICRSPTAEAVFQKVVDDAGLSEQVVVDSCGTGGGSPNWYEVGGFSYHEGDAADTRMMRAAAARGIKLTSRSRPLKADDVRTFDYIVAMDPTNGRDIVRAASYWAQRVRPGEAPLPDVRSKLSLMMEHSKKDPDNMSVPDPYYGGSDGFELVLDLLEEACVGLLQRVRTEHGV